MKKGLFFLLFFVCGCVRFVDDVGGEKSGNPFKMPEIDYRYDFMRGKISFCGDEVYLSDIARYLLKFGEKFVYSDDFHDRSASFMVDGSSLAEFFREVETKYNLSISKVGRLWVASDRRQGDGKKASSPSSSIISHASGGFSSSIPGDGGGYVYYFPVFGYMSDEVLTSLSEFGIKRVGNGFYLYRGDLAGALALDEALVRMAINQPIQYFFTVWFVSEDFVNDLGVSLSPQVRASLGKSWSIDHLPYSYSAVMELVAAGNFDVSKNKSVRKVSGVVREGSEFVFTLGDDVPMVKRTVSDSGTVTDTGYEYQKYGVTLNIKVEGRGRGALTCKLSNTDIGSYVGGYPIRHGSNLETCLVVQDASPMYVGSCVMLSDKKGVLTFYKSMQKFHVFIQCDLISVGQSVSPVGFDLLHQNEKN